MLVPDLGTSYIVPIIGTMFKSLHSPEYARLIAWLREQREGQNLSMRDLAETLGTPHSFIGKTEQGERRLDVVEYLYYCEALGLAPEKGLKIMKG